MPLVPGKSKSAFEKNIAIERKAGKPEKQAVAIAYSKRGEGKDAQVDADAEELARVYVTKGEQAARKLWAEKSAGLKYGQQVILQDKMARLIKAAKAKDSDLEPIPTPAEKKLALAKHAAGITKSQDKWSSAEEQKYFDLRKKHQAKLEAKNPGESSNRLRAHESAMKEMGEKAAPYALGKDDDLKKLRDARAKALDMEPIPVPGKDAFEGGPGSGHSYIPYKGFELREFPDYVLIQRKGGMNVAQAKTLEAAKKLIDNKYSKAKDSEVPIGFAAGKSPEFRRAEWERRQAELREANARERAERQKKKAKDEEPKANARNDGHLAGIKKHWNSKIYAHYASIYNAEGKAAADKYLQQFTTRKVEDSVQISGSEPKANARNDGHLASIKKHWNSKIYAHYASIYNAEGKAAADKYLQQFTTRKVEDSAQISGSEPQDHLARANQYEIAGDRARALDSYRAAASGYRRLGNHQGEDSARDGIVECQRRLVGGHEGLYDHPSKGKHQAFDSADRALTSALQRTRAGEYVRITDSGFEVIPAGTKRAKDALPSEDALFTFHQYSKTGTGKTGSPTQIAKAIKQVEKEHGKEQAEAVRQYAERFK